MGCVIAESFPQTEGIADEFSLPLLNHNIHHFVVMTDANDKIAGVVLMHDGGKELHPVEHTDSATSRNGNAL